MNKILLKLGDWSDDGHGKTEDVFIQCNLTMEELQAAYKKGSKKVGVNLSDDVCCEYEDSSIDDETRNELEKAGLELPYSEWGIDATDFANLWMAIATIGNPDLKWEHDNLNVPTIDIGGYGLL